MLTSGARSDTADVAEKDGRLDLRNLHLQEPHPMETVQNPIATLSLFTGITTR